jgi:hypothetical protein
MTLYRAIVAMRWISALGLHAGIGFLLAPPSDDVEPFAVSVLADSVPMFVVAKTRADSLTEDIILYNLFAAGRTAPARRYAAASAAIDDRAMFDPDTPSPSVGGGFRPELIGTAVSERPGETRALLRLLANDPAPRLYGVGDRAGGYSVISIDARAVVLSGPRGRVVLRLPENEESHS